MPVLNVAYDGYYSTSSRKYTGSSDELDIARMEGRDGDYVYWIGFMRFNMPSVSSSKIGTATLTFNVTSTPSSRWNRFIITAAATKTLTDTSLGSGGSGSASGSPSVSYIVGAAQTGLHTVDITSVFKFMLNNGYNAIRIEANPRSDDLVETNVSAKESGNGATIEYTVTNTAPTTPSSITVPSTVKSGDSFTISWGKSTDPDGDSVSYRLYRSINGGSYSLIYSGSSLSTTDTAQSSWDTVQYRVRAYDGMAYSGYRISSIVTVKHFPEFNMKINNELKTAESGWVKINGQLREIDSIWVKVNGMLKEV